jgi:4-hydroxymandelate oxidase
VTDLLTLDDYEQQARSSLTHMACEYLTGGAGDELTVRWNREAFGRIRLRPRVLEDVTTIDTSVSLLGQRMRSPLILGPIAYQKLVHPDGETGSARGAAEEGLTCVVSTAANCSIEDVAAAGANLWMQIYIQEEREVTRELVHRAEAAGVRAFCLTVDTPVLGTRNRQQRAGFALPAHLSTPHLDPRGRERLAAVNGRRVAVTWSDVEWLRSIAHVPVLLKGILDPDDADRAVDRGADGIIVSNHGGRNLDTVPATIDALPHVVSRVAGRLPVLMDGGIRRGTDVVKALALGASAVLVGRPYVYGLAVAGTEGVRGVIRILQEELETAMALLGRPSIAQLDDSIIWRF